MKVLKIDIQRYSNKNTYFEIIRKYFTNRGFKAVFLYRLSNFFYKKNLKILAMFFQHRNIRLNSCEIGYETEIGPGMKIRHPMGIVISGNSILGRNVTIAQNVTIGEKKEGFPIIGDECDIGAGAVVLGKLKVYDKVTIGANALVTKDVSGNSVIGGVPFKYLRTKNNE